MTDAVTIDTIIHSVETLGILCGGAFAIFKMGRALQKIDSGLQNNQQDVAEMKVQLDKMDGVMATIGEQKAHLDFLDRSVVDLRQEIRHRAA